MRTQHIVLVAFGFLLGVLLAIGTARIWFGPIFVGRTESSSSQLTAQELHNLQLHAELRDGVLVGQIFNKNPDVLVSQITVEAVQENKDNHFYKKYGPRIYNVDVVAKPRTMSAEFRVETGAINPDTHSLLVLEAVGQRVSN